MNPQDPYQQLPNPDQPQNSSLPPVPAGQPSYTQQQPNTPQPQPQPNTENPFAAAPQTPSAPYSPAPQFTATTPFTNTNAPLPDDYSTVDYLNRIAPQEQKTVNRFAVFGLIGAVIASVIAVVMMMVSSQGSQPNDLMPPLAQRIDTLASVSNAETHKLTQNEIVEANSSLSSTLTSMKSQLETIMKERKLKTSSANKTEKTYLETLQKKLDDAHQKGTLDRTYTTQMTYELSLLKSQVNKLKRSTNSSSVTEFCNTSITNIDTILAAYAKFDAAKQ